MILDILLIQIILVYIIDLSGVSEHIKRGIWKWLKGKDKPYKDFELKPFLCSLCMTFWTGLLYLLLTHQFTLTGILVVSLASYLTTTTNNLLLLIKDTIDVMLYKLSSKINR